MQTTSEDIIPPLYLTEAKAVKGIWKYWVLLRAIFFFIFFMAACLLANFFQMIAFVLSLCIPKYGDRMQTFVAGLCFVFFVNVIERFAGVEIEFSGDKLPSHENAICISNHCADTDLYVIGFN